jgi:sugar phosphate isomerase/epimerase
VIHCGYGRLEIPSSRFNRAVPLAAHLEQLAASLREAAKLAEDRGMIIGVENHCDFRGWELASVFDAVASPAIRAALDTGNSFTVFCDPVDDLLALAPLTVTTHLKEMRVVQLREEMVLAPDESRVPFLPVVCALGDGHVDIGHSERERRTHDDLAGPPTREGRGRRRAHSSPPRASASRQPHPTVATSRRNRGVV